MATDFQTKSVVNIPELSTTQTPSAWADATAYVQGNYVTSDGATYKALTNHTSSSSNAPPNTVWEETNVSGIVDLVPVYTVGQATVHAIYISNKHTGDVHFYLQMRDGSNNHKGYILFNTVVPAQSTMVIEKPINLTVSSTASDQRKLSIYASAEEKLDAMASVLVIT